MIDSRRRKDKFLLHSTNLNYHIKIGEQSINLIPLKLIWNIAFYNSNNIFSKPQTTSSTPFGIIDNYSDLWIPHKIWSGSANSPPQSPFSWSIHYPAQCKVVIGRFPLPIWFGATAIKRFPVPLEKLPPLVAFGCDATFAPNPPGAQ